MRLLQRLPHRSPSLLLRPPLRRPSRLRPSLRRRRRRPQRRQPIPAPPAGNNNDLGTSPRATAHAGGGPSGLRPISFASRKNPYRRVHILPPSLTSPEQEDNLP